MKHIFILVDALKSLYLTAENMPFLYSMAQKGLWIKQVYPSPGFCERSDIFTGLGCNETGNFTAIGYDTPASPYKDKIAINLASFVSLLSDKVTRYLFRKYRAKHRIPLRPYQIPYRSLSHFTLTEDGEKKYAAYQEITDSLKAGGKSYTLDYFTSLSDLKRRTSLPILEFVGKAIADGVDFVPLYVGTIDTVGHKYGSAIEKIRPYLKEVDDTIAAIAHLAENSGHTLSVLGDHGMVPVSERIDVISTVKATGLKLHHDYESFVDSTMVRYWSDSPSVIEKIKDAINSSFPNKGTFVTPENCHSFGIPMDIKNELGEYLYGDLLWCVNPGILLSPDFFNPKTKPINGMHGYLETVPGEGTGLFVSNGESNFVEETAHLSDICGHLCEAMEIEAPNKRII